MIKLNQEYFNSPYYFYLKDKEKDGETKPVMIHLISNYLTEMSNKKKNYMNKLDDTYGVKNFNYTPDTVNEDDKNILSK